MQKVRSEFISNEVLRLTVRCSSQMVKDTLQTAI